jgi:hypothetical protein
MRKLVITLGATVAILLAGALTWKAEAQTTRGAANIPAASENFTPIVKAGCGFVGPHCGPRRHWVCGPYGRRCWCAPCY